MVIIKQFSVLFTIGIIFVFTNCTTRLDSAPNSIDHPPTPKTASILPLALGNYWEFSFTLHDSSGTPKQNFQNMTLRLDITHVYGLTTDSQIVKLNKNTKVAIKDTLYCLAWDKKISGDIVCHKGDGPVETRGLYVYGTFEDTILNLIDTPYLWLMFPSDSGKSWVIPNKDSLRETGGSVLVNSTNAQIYYIDNNSQYVSPIKFTNCYLYFYKTDQSESYYYYNPSIGPVCYMRYENGRKVKTYILKNHYLRSNESLHFEN